MILTSDAGGTREIDGRSQIAGIPAENRERLVETARVSGNESPEYRRKFDACCQRSMEKRFAAFLLIDL
jgi:hypothetical protein